MAFVVKNPHANAGDSGLIPGPGRSPGGGHGNPFQYSCLENPHGQRILAGYSPEGCTKSDTTKVISMHAQALLLGVVADPKNLIHFCPKGLLWE